MRPSLMGGRLLSLSDLRFFAYPCYPCTHSPSHAEASERSPWSQERTNGSFDTFSLRCTWSCRDFGRARSGLGARSRRASGHVCAVAVLCAPSCRVYIYMYTWHESVLRPSDSRCYESVLHRLKCGGGAEDERKSADCGVSPWCAGHTRTLWCRDRKLASSACVDEHVLI